MTRTIRRAAACSGLALAYAIPCGAQHAPATDSGARSETQLYLLGGWHEDLRRLDHLIVGASTAGWLARTASALAHSTPERPRGVRWRLLAPTGDVVWNSSLPFSLNDGALWSGRGVNARIAGGVHLQSGRWTIRVAPELLVAQNRGFPILPGNSRRSSYSSPWHAGAWSADLPLRFGGRSLVAVVPGQSRVAISTDRLELGASTEEQWWGPGIRNALVMSNNAGGIPHLFIQTKRPARLAGAELEARWIAGALTESLYFDDDDDNDQRTLSAAVVTVRPLAVPAVTLGIARAVYSDASDAGKLRTHAADAFFRWRTLGDSAARGDGADQITSLFARWTLPASGAEIYGEWARLRLPTSLRDLVTAPQRSQGWTAGLQWARAVDEGRVRVQAELSTLEQTPRMRGDGPSFYTSRAVSQGYTHRGQILGAAIGPGASSQWLATDYLTSQWRAGVFAGRVRWENDAYYRQVNSAAYFAHDVSTLLGVRGGTTFGKRDVGVEITSALRRNYLFQNIRFGYVADPTFDVRNVTIRIRVEPSDRPGSAR